MTLDRFEELHERLADGLATEAEQRELAALLQSDAALRRRLVDRSLEAVQLRKILTGAEGADGAHGTTLGEGSLQNTTLSPPVTFWRMSLWTAAAALLLCAAGYALWQLQAEKPAPRQQAVAPIQIPDVSPIPPPPPEQPWPGTPILQAGKLLVDGVENGAIHSGSVLTNPSASGGTNAALTVEYCAADLTLAPGTQIVWQPDIAKHEVIVRLNAGRITYHAEHLDSSLFVETAALRIGRDMFEMPHAPDLVKAEFSVEISGPVPALTVTAAQADRRRVSVAATTGAVAVSQAGSAAGTAAQKISIAAGKQRVFRTGRLSRHVEENEENEENEAHEGGREEVQPEPDGGNTPVPTEPSARPNAPAAP